MALSRILSQSLPRASLRPSITHHRHRSSKPRHAHLIELELDLDAASPDSPDPDVAAFTIRAFEEALHTIIVRRAAPDWLPFLPGHSYWVPPRARNTPAASMIEALQKLNPSQAARNHRLHHEFLSEDEQMSLVSAKGWPSSTYFIEGNQINHQLF